MIIYHRLENLYNTQCTMMQSSAAHSPELYREKDNPSNPANTNTLMHKYKYKEYCRVKGKPSYPGLGGRAKPSRDRFTSSKKPRTLCQPFHLSADLIPYIYTLYLTPYTLYLILYLYNTYICRPIHLLLVSIYRFTSQKAHSLLSTFTAMLHLHFHLPTY